jgi:hypothetical protein
VPFQITKNSQGIAGGTFWRRINRNNFRHHGKVRKIQVTRVAGETEKVPLSRATFSPRIAMQNDAAIVKVPRGNFPYKHVPSIDYC